MDKEGAELTAKDRLLDMAMSKISGIQREVIQRSYLDDEFDYISCGALVTGLPKNERGLLRDFGFCVKSLSTR
ncbi:hypothetical protein BK135_26410 [Paenibacillus peoriae]|nr:hypothetical protein BK135_26410 [Paenibacillus peoriae]